MFNQTFRIHFTIFGTSMDKSFMPCEPISHPLKKNIFLRKVTKAHQKKASKTDIKDMPFNVTWCRIFGVIHVPMMNGVFAEVPQVMSVKW